MARFDASGPARKGGLFPPNGFGLHDMAGNVWEWTDYWWTARHPDAADTPCCVPHNPRGGDLESSFDANQQQFRVPRKVIKGGSHLCAGFLIAPAVQRIQQRLGQIGTGTKKLHLFADLHRRHTTGNSIIVSELRQHQIVALVLDRRSKDREA